MMWTSKRRWSGVAATTAAATFALALLGAAPLGLANEPNNGPSHGLCESREICGPWQHRDNDAWRWRYQNHDNDRYSRPYYSHPPSYYRYPNYY